MRRYVAFLRAINVGGHVVKMEVLREAFEALGFANVSTFIASGNVIFESPSKDTAGLEKKIEGALSRGLGYEVATFIRTPTEVSAIAAYQPFPAPMIAKARALNVGLLKAPIESSARALVDSFKTDIDDFHLHGAEIYWLCRQSQMDSKFTNARFERALKISATFRGLRTIERLAAKYPAP